jgi:hypothetical protein
MGRCETRTQRCKALASEEADGLRNVTKQILGQSGEFKRVLRDPKEDMNAQFSIPRSSDGGSDCFSLILNVVWPRGRGIA